ncbi:MAG: hypothetical protein PHC61_07445 [Chitinivibrionales bacterium]|nr:hypothetical protein [Chitinivibrionales bacterium]
MNRNVIVILIGTVLSIVLLSLIAFGPFTRLRNQKSFNTASLIRKTIPNNDSLADYLNKDVKENYYKVMLPVKWAIKAGDKPGSYTMEFPHGYGSIALMDVPDNTTLELYILSQEEPRLKKAVPGYQRLNYRKAKVNGNDAYILLFEEKSGNPDSRTMAAYISGADNAVVIRLTADTTDFKSLEPSFNRVMNSFNWRNQ